MIDKEKSKTMGKEMVQKLNEVLKDPWRVNSVSFSEKYGYFEKGKTSGPYDMVVRARANYIGKCNGFRVEGHVEGADFDELVMKLEHNMEWYERVTLKEYALHIVEKRVSFSAMDRKVLRKALEDGQGS